MRHVYRSLQTTIERLAVILPRHDLSCDTNWTGHQKGAQGYEPGSGLKQLEISKYMNGATPAQAGREAPHVSSRRTPDQAIVLIVQHLRRSQGKAPIGVVAVGAGPAIRLRRRRVRRQHACRGNPAWFTITRKWTFDMETQHYVA